MKKNFFILILLLSSYLLNAQQFTIFHTNDHHGRPLSSPVFDLDGGGLPSRKCLIDGLKFKYKNVLILDAGDINDGLIESDYFTAEPDIIGYNEIGYDAMTIGNHEFYNPLEVLEKQQKLAKFPFLCANILKADNSYIGKPYIIKTINNVRIGIIGLTTNTTKSSASINITKNLIFKDEVETAKQLVAILKDSTDVIIALTHLGIYSGQDKGSLKLAKEVSGIDFIIDGHSHTFLEKPIWVKRSETDSVAVVQAACWGAFLGVADLEYKDNHLVVNSWEPISINASDKGQYIGKGILKDIALQRKLLPYKLKVESLLGEVIGQSDSVYTDEQVRYKPGKLGTLTANSMVWHYKSDKADFAFTNGGGIRNPLNNGPIRKMDIYNILPFENKLSLIEVKGKTIQKMCEQLVKNRIGTGGYLQFSEGFKLDYANGKINSILINGVALKNSKKYRIVTNSYLASGGDNYQMLLDGELIKESEGFQRDYLIKYISEYLQGKVKL